jgi:hypothetical protein
MFKPKVENKQYRMNFWIIIIYNNFYNNMYSNYLKYIEGIIDDDDESMTFKSNPEYNIVLENVTKNSGTDYLILIEQEFPEVSFQSIRSFININDKYGGSMKSIFTTTSMKLLYCSPTNFRYIYHALLILKKIKDEQLTEIVELGSGYGGLCLAIQFFSKLLDISIKNYTMVELNEPARLIQKYMNMHIEHLHIPLTIVDDKLDGYEKGDNQLFVSNYCFTAINQTYRKIYIDTIIKDSESGFIVWQTCFGQTKESANLLLKKLDIFEEKPQTAPLYAKNLFVLWVRS